MADGVLPMTIQEAFAVAETELSQASDGATTEGMPPAVTQATATPQSTSAPSVSTEQTPTGTVDELLKGLETKPALAADPSSPDFWKLEVEITTDDGPKRMTLDDMRKGTMMRADYTRKTQELARDRGVVSEAVEFHQAFKEDPQGFAKFLAAKAGLISTDGVPAKDGVKVFTEDQVNSLVAERLAKALEEHPDVTKARTTEAIAAVDQVFDSLELTYGEISRENRLKVLNEAEARGTADVRLVFESMLLRASQLAAGRAAAKQVAPAKPGGTPSAELIPEPKMVKTVQEAWALAEKELAGTVA